MKGILADINIQGQMDILVKRMQAEPWVIFWEHLGLAYCRFADVDLDPDLPDSLVWQFCQAEGFSLITDNRNKHRPDSLEATIRELNSDVCLPVFTVANATRILFDKAYGDRVIEKLLDFLLRIETLRGTGRLYLP